MRRLLAPGAVVLALSVLAGCAGETEETVRLADAWKFQAGDSLAWAAADFDDAAWKPIRPDRTWEPQGWEAYDGYGWYRAAFTLPAALKEKAAIGDSLQILLGKIDDTDQAFLNGRLIGQNGTPAAPGSGPGRFEGDPAAYALERRYVLGAEDPRILWGKVNVLAVRVHDHGGGGGLYTRVPEVSMVDIKDYVELDFTSLPFVPGEGTRYEKTVVLRNRSRRHAFEGAFTVRAVRLDTGKEVFRASRPVGLGAPGEASYTFTFESAPDWQTRVFYSFRESRTGRTLSGMQELPFILTPPPPEQPRINGAGVYGQRPGRPFLYRIPASGLGPMTFAAEGLPPGITLDPAAGILSGSCAKPGTYAVTLGAKNERGETSRSIKIVIGDRLALTPPLGWNSWNCWGLAVDDAKVRAAADAFERSGLADHGWAYINIDDGWEDPVRRPDGEIRTNAKFPDMKRTADYVHSKGLKLGIYSSPGPLTCGGYTGSYRHEEQDARTYAKWGIDYLKYDWCSYGTVYRGDGIAGFQKPYRVMRAALDKAPRDIVYSLCQYGMGRVWEWGGEVGGNCWRTTGDITDTWKSMADIGFDQTVQWKHSAPGNWNDPDMLVVGWVGWGPTLHPTRLTANEQYTHISLWSLLASPLLIGCDLTKLDAFTLNLLTNDEVLAVNQDPLGRQAKPVSAVDSVQVWARPLEDGSLAVGVFNLGLEDKKASVSWKDLGLEGKRRVRDLWRQKDLGVFSGRFETGVFSHGVSLVKITAEK